MIQPAPAAKASSSFHRLDRKRCSQDGTVASSSWAGGGTATARTAAVTPKPAQRAAATSSIESVQQLRRLADSGKPCICAIGNSLERTNPMPPAVGAERHQVAHHGTAVVHACDKAH